MEVELLIMEQHSTASSNWQLGNVDMFNQENDSSQSKKVFATISIDICAEFCSRRYFIGIKGQRVNLRVFLFNDVF